MFTSNSVAKVLRPSLFTSMTSKQCSCSSDEEETMVQSFAGEGRVPDPPKSVSSPPSSPSGKMQKRALVQVALLPGLAGFNRLMMWSAAPLVQCFDESSPTRWPVQCGCGFRDRFLQPK